MPRYNDDNIYERDVHEMSESMLAYLLGETHQDNIAIENEDVSDIDDNVHELEQVMQQG